MGFLKWIELAVMSCVCVGSVIGTTLILELQENGHSRDVHRISYNVTPEGLLLKFEPDAPNVTIPIQSISQHLQPPGRWTAEEKEKNEQKIPFHKFQSPQNDYYLPVAQPTGRVKKKRPAQKKVDKIDKAREGEGGLNETVHTIYRSIESGSKGIQKFITNVQTRKSMGLQEIIGRISSGTHFILNRIFTGLHAFGKGFTDLTQTIFEGGDCTQEEETGEQEDEIFGTMEPSMESEEEEPKVVSGGYSN